MRQANFSPIHVKWPRFGVTFARIRFSPVRKSEMSTLASKDGPLAEWQTQGT